MVSVASPVAREMYFTRPPLNLNWLVLVGGRSGLGVVCTDAQSSKCQRTLSRHCFQGIIELDTTVTTDLIGSVSDREHAAERTCDGSQTGNRQQFRRSESCFLPGVMTTD